MKYLSWADGKKTYLVCLVAIGLGVIDSLNQAGITHIVVPFYVNWFIAGLGGAAMRKGIQSQSSQITAEVLQAISQPPKSEG